MTKRAKKTIARKRKPLLSQPGRRLTVISVAAVLCLGAIALIANGLRPESRASSMIPLFDHVVVVVDENHSYSQIMSGAPYIASLTKQGAYFTNSHALAHPSEPNYLMLFSGSNQGITTDTDCAHRFSARSLGGQVIASGRSFIGYSESLPSTGYRGCNTSLWAQRHVPWASFNDIPAASNMSTTSLPTDFTKLPTVSFVTPNVNDDMHNGTVAQGDSWLKGHLGGYVAWAKTHNSLFILTFDEDDTNSAPNQIMTVMVGAHVKTGSYSEYINHYTVLRTLEDMYGLSALGGASGVSSIKDIWSSSTTPTPVPPGPSHSPAPTPAVSIAPTRTPTPAVTDQATPTPTPDVQTGVSPSASSAPTTVGSPSGAQPGTEAHASSPAPASSLPAPSSAHETTSSVWARVLNFFLVPVHWLRHLFHL